MRKMQLTRRSLVQSMAAGSAYLGLRGIAHAAGGEVIYGARGGISDDVFQQVIVAPFQQTSGIQVKNVPYPDLAKLQAMVQTGTVDLDVWEVDGKALRLMTSKGLLEPINYSLLPPNLDQDLVPGAVQSHGVGNVLFGAGIIYNKDVYKDAHPRSWAEFWDIEKFPGARTLPHPSYQITAFEAALLADGVEPQNIYPMDVDRAFRSFDKIKPSVTKFWTKAAEGLTLATSGNADLAMLTFGRVTALQQKEPTPLTVEMNQGIVTTAYWVIPKGAKNVENAHKLIAFFLDAKNQANYINAYPAFGPVNKNSTQYIDPKFEDIVVSSKTNSSKIVIVNDDWWASPAGNGKSNYEAILDRWNEWAGN